MQGHVAKGPDMAVVANRHLRAAPAAPAQMPSHQRCCLAAARRFWPNDRVAIDPSGFVPFFYVLE